MGGVRMGVRLEHVSTGKMVEYRYFCFADIYEVKADGKLVGHWYKDSCDKRSWYCMRVSEEHWSKFEELVKYLSSDHTLFDEGCIRTFGLYSAEKIAERMLELKLV